MAVVAVHPVLTVVAVSYRTRSRVLKNNVKIMQAHRHGKEAG